MDVILIIVTVILTLIGLCIVIAVPLIAIAITVYLDHRKLNQEKEKKMATILSTGQVITAERAEIISRLQRWSWFNNTPSDIRAQLLALDSDYNGFLSDLADRPDKLDSGTTQLKIVQLHLLPFGLCGVVYWVETPEGLRYWDQYKKGTKEPGSCLTPATYEFAAWKAGRKTGAKGIVRILNDAGQPTHLVWVRGHKFATNDEEDGATGGFGSGGWNNFLKELTEELGFKKAPEVLARHELSVVVPDSGLSSETIDLFCADISGKEAKEIGKIKNIDVDKWEMADIGPRVVPIEELPKIIHLINEGFLHSVLLRLVGKGLIPPQSLVEA